MSFTASTNSAANPGVDAAKHKFDRWLETPAGEYYWAREAGAIDQHLKYLPGPHVLSMGSDLSARNAAVLAANRDFPYLYVVGSHKQGVSFEESDLRTCSALPESLPFGTDSMSSVLVTHALEMCAQPDQVLREIKRVLQPEGYVLFTGFNTISPNYWGIGKWALRGSKYPKSIWHPRLADWLRLLEFEIVASSMFAYAPTSIAPRILAVSEAIEKAGNRWWPLLGGAYILVARKTVLGRKFVGGKLRTLFAHGKVVLGPSSTSSQQKAIEAPYDYDQVKCAQIRTT